MREINFRAWDGEKMISAILIREGGIPVIDILPNGGSIELKYLQNLKFMQFTGLKDKNGVEIYEGDIVQVYKHMSQEKGKVYLVQWSEERCEYNGIFPSIAVWVAHEVIGNIYQDKHLLENENPELLADQPPMIGEPAHPTGEGMEQ